LLLLLIRTIIMQKISSSITRKRLILVSALTVILWIGWKMAATRSNHIFSSSSSSSPSSALPTAEQVCEEVYTDATML
jgi:hypothetical protein